MRRHWTTLACVLTLCTVTIRRTSGKQCPDPAASPSCHCYDFENGIHLECPGATVQTLRMLFDVVKTPIQSLSIYEPDKSLTKLPKNIVPEPSIVRNLQISQSNIEELHEDALTTLKVHLESFALVSAKLRDVPQKTFKSLDKLTSLDLEDNKISQVPNYTLYGLKLNKLNLKKNQLRKMDDYSFVGLERTLFELDLSENKLSAFPINALGRLEQLRELRLAYNEISTIAGETYSHLNFLHYLDLSYNRFRLINRDTFKVCLAIRTLTLYWNAIETVHEDTFIMLRDLESLDLSRNRIVYLSATTFRRNKKIRSVDLSRNHLHDIGGVLAFLPNLREVFLSENNVLELRADAFKNSTNLSVIYMQDNAIGRLDEDAFATLSNLTQLHLSCNFITYLPPTVLRQNRNLTSLNLDNNRLAYLERGTFRGMTALREIRLHNNKIQSVYEGVFAALPELLELHLQHNEISCVEEGAFRTLANLQHVNLQNNLIEQLGDVFPDNYTGLVSVQLENNRIGTLHVDTFRRLTDVQIMWLGHNRLVEIRNGTFRDCCRLKKLFVNDNDIARLHENALHCMRRLKVLDASGNRLEGIASLTLSTLDELEELNLSRNVLSSIADGAFINLKKLRSLDLSFNPLMVVGDALLRGGLSVRFLALANCSIARIEPDAFRNLNNLNDLNLADNELSAADVRHLNIPGLRVLKLSRNNLSELDDKSLSGLPSLQVLSLDNSTIGSLPEGIFVGNKNLIDVDLSANSLTKLPQRVFFQSNILKRLHLDANNLSTIPHVAFSNISTMEYLYLSRNALVSLEVYQLNGMPNLRHLNLSSNSIAALTGFGSANLHQLVTVDLSGNRLSTLPTNFFHRSALLQRVDLSGNRFRHMPNAALSGITLPGLGWLDISGNPIVNMHDNGPTRSYPSLEKIRLEHSDLIVITSKEFELFPSLLHAYLGHNKILKISPGAFSSLHSLISLDLGVNQIEIVPQERLCGLNNLRSLNITRNRLKTLDQFPANLKLLEILDASYNHINRLNAATFAHLSSLTELYLAGNNLATVAPEAFRSLKILKLLDLRRNYFEQMPLKSLKSIETQVRTIYVDDNPLACTCESETFWDWLRSHGKQLNQMGDDRLICESPEEVRGAVFADLNLEQFCDQPLVLKVGIQDIQPFSVLVSWQARNQSGLLGYQVIYYPTDTVEEIKGKILDNTARSLKLINLYPGIKYHICVFALGNWNGSKETATSLSSRVIKKPSTPNNNNTFGKQYGFETFSAELSPFLVDSSTSRCTEVLTLGAPDLSVLQENSMSVQSILTRRLGLFIGCCLGLIVFVLLLSILGYIKARKERHSVKRNQPTPVAPPECLSYRHFSLQSAELPERSGHPHFITNLSTPPTLN